MTLIKSILLGSAAGLVVVAGAQAADLPTRKAAPVAEYVKICNVNGTAGFIIPGSDTCLKLYGDVKFETIMTTLKTGYLYGVGFTNPSATGGISPTSQAIATQTSTGSTNLRNAFEMGGRADLGFTASSNTAWGPLVADAMLEGNVTNNQAGVLPGTFGNGFALDHATATWAGLTFGYVGSFYNLGNGNGDLDYFSPDPGTVPLIAYTAHFGGGFSATLSIEDGVSRRTNGTANALLLANNPAGTTTPVVTAYTNTYNGTQFPDIVAQIGVTQGWGSAKIAGAAHNTNLVSGPLGTAFGGTNFWGFGVNAAVSFNIPQMGPKSEFTIQGAWSHGALAFGGVTAPGVIPFNGNGAAFYLNDAVQTGTITGGVITGTGFSEPTSFSVASHLLWQVNPQFSFEPQVAYGQIDYGSNVTVFSQKLTSWMGGGIFHWDPVTNLDFQLDLIYISSNQSTPTSLVAGTPWQTNSSGFFGRLGIARTF